MMADGDGDGNGDARTGNGLDGQATGALQINAQLFFPAPCLRVTKTVRHLAHALRAELAPSAPCLS